MKIVFIPKRLYIAAKFVDAYVKSGYRCMNYYMAFSQAITCKKFLLMHRVRKTIICHCFQQLLCVTMGLLLGATALQAQTNTAPVLGGSASITTTEDATTPTSVAVSTLGTATDADNTPNTAPIGRVITGVSNQALGNWQYRVGSNAWTDIPIITTANWLPLGASDQIRFNPNANVNRTTGTLPSVTIRAWDGTQGTAGTAAASTTFGSGATSSSSMATIDVTVMITAVNDRPGISGSGSITTTEDAMTPTSVAVSTLGTATDVDDTPMAPHNATIGRLVTAIDARALGNWQYRVGSNAWTDIPIITTANWLPLGASDQIRFNPNANVNRTTGTLPSVTIRAWDGTQGTAGTAAASTTFGSGATSSSSMATIDVTVMITAVNDQPTIAGMNITIATREDVATTGTVVSAIGTTADVDVTPMAPHAATLGRAVVSFNNQGLGNWEYLINGTTTWIDIPDLLGQQLLPLNANDQIRFNPSANLSRPTATTMMPLPSITFRAWDGTQGTAHAVTTVTAIGGNGATSSLSPSGGAGRINVTATIAVVNDRPVLSGNTSFPATEDGRPGPDLVSNLGTATDVDNTPNNAAMGRLVTAFDNQSLGRWQYLVDGTTNWVDIPTLSSRWLPLNANELGTLSSKC